MRILIIFVLLSKNFKGNEEKVYTAFICLCCAVVSLFAQERVVELTNPNESCTSIAAGKLATTDGSVMTSQTCDGTSRTWMEVVPAQNWPDTAKLDLYWDLRHNGKAKTTVWV